MKIELSKKLSSALSAYKKDKTSINRDELFKVIEEVFRYVSDSGDDSLVSDMLEANFVIPLGQSFPLLNVLDEDNRSYNSSGFIKVLNKPLWDYLPENCKVIYNVKKLNVKSPLDPSDVNIQKVMDNTNGNDELRPLMQGASYEKDGVTSTDAHALFHYSDELNKSAKEGVYLSEQVSKKNYRQFVKGLKDIEDFTFEKYYKKYKNIDGKYPNWRGVIPTNSIKQFTTSITFLASIIETLQKNAFVHIEVRAIALESSLESDGVTEFNKVYFNLTHLLRVFKAFSMLGIDEIDIFYNQPNRAIIVTEKDALNYEDSNLYNIQNVTFGLVMPLFEPSFMSPTIYSVGDDMNRLGLQLLNKDNVIEKVSLLNASNKKTSSFPKPKPPLKKESEKSESKSDDKIGYFEEQIEGFKDLMELTGDKA